MMYRDQNDTPPSRAAKGKAPPGMTVIIFDSLIGSS